VTLAAAQTAMERADAWRAALARGERPTGRRAAA
jgi:hypothetical protein